MDTKSTIRIKRKANGYYAVQRREGKKYITLAVCSSHHEATYWANLEAKVRGEEVQK